jgi:hypothetical protein
MQVTVAKEGDYIGKKLAAIEEELIQVGVSTVSTRRPTSLPSC